eukprot:3830538-Pleurochrysis_carterae.AAC.1
MQVAVAVTVRHRALHAHERITRVKHQQGSVEELSMNCAEMSAPSTPAAVPFTAPQLSSPPFQPIATALLDDRPVAATTSRNTTANATNVSTTASATAATITDTAASTAASTTNSTTAFTTASTNTASTNTASTVATTAAVATASTTAAAASPRARLPFVSVLLPVYNAMPWLPLAVRSCLMQQGVRTQLIAVDDGCTDGSGEFLV